MRLVIFWTMCHHSLGHEKKALLTLINRAGGALWEENLDRRREYGPNALRSVHTTEAKILSYRPTKLLG